MGVVVVVVGVRPRMVTIAIVVAVVVVDTAIVQVTRLVTKEEKIMYVSYYSDGRSDRDYY